MMIGVKNDRAVHLWYSNMSPQMQEKIDTVSHEIQQHLEHIYNREGIKCITEMTEINVSSKNKKNSDKIYFTRHFDAPFNLSNCKIIRALVGINGSSDTITVFSNDRVSIKTGMVALFDYNRSPHYVELSNTGGIDMHGENGGSGPRITLKLQFVIPNSDSWCSKVHQNWSTFSRSKLESTQDNYSLVVHIGIIASYLLTYMHYIILITLCLLAAYMYTKSTLIYSLFMILYIYIVIQWSYNLIMIIFLSL